MSFRLRITLWYTTLLAVLLLLIVVMSRSIVHASVLSDIDRDLRQRGDSLQAWLNDRLVTGSTAGVIPPAVGAAFEPEVYVQVRSFIERRVTYRSPNLTNKVLPVPEPYFDHVLDGKSGYYSMTFNQPDDLRVFYAPITFGGEVVGVLLVGRTVAPEQAILRQLAVNFVWLAVAALGVGAGIGYWLAGVALRPIQEATSTALAITRTGSLERRVPIAASRNDEVGILISTFNEMLGRLQELFEKERRFSGDISHELRSPLTTILGNIGLLKRKTGLPSAERAEMIEEIESEAQRMRRLISDLLLLAQADANLTISKEPVELDTMLLDVYRQTRRRAGDREVHLSHEDQAIVQGDADRLRQMLDNLVDNAIQYSPPGARIDLSLECRGTMAQLTVADTGHGIAAEDLPYIFDRFYRADKARSRSAGGTGLGLSIVKWVVNAHWGEIDVQSTVGVGTIFRVRLPLAAGCDDETEPSMDSQPVAA